MRKKTTRVLIAMSVLIAGSLAYVGSGFAPRQTPVPGGNTPTTADPANPQREPVVVDIEIDTDATDVSFQTATPDPWMTLDDGEGTTGLQRDGEPITFLIEPAAGDDTGATPGGPGPGSASPGSPASGDGNSGPWLAGAPAHGMPAVNQPSQFSNPGGRPSPGSSTPMAGPAHSGGPASSGGSPGPDGPTTSGGPASPGAPDNDPTGAQPPTGDPLPSGPLLADLPATLPMLLDVPEPLGKQQKTPYTPPGGNSPANTDPANTTVPSPTGDDAGPVTQTVAANRTAPGINVSAPSALALLSVGMLGMLARRRRRS